ncbi:LytR/AlgR family response regulator transcription factor [Colwellia psychrerythraea]|uniref:Transcriptional regulator, LytTR family n=1 Tax=Colwellia psychrerythraea TaxID=28229 RepID=A0A099KM16_COLPS|nr:LytTR family DNA-binding domain-containing protein [Colwellia psychrerythraea]KGJ90977.1 transcriptional regulator, LytTR family [Colwellia psychrerythraea]
MLLRILLIVLAVSVTTAHATSLISIDNSKILVCPANEESNLETIFTRPDCQLKNLHDINPQQQALWLKASLNIKQKSLTQQFPLALYIFGKTSSEAFFNGVYLGKNGTPAVVARNEFIGNMDARFYLPPELIKQGENEVIFYLSAHHGFLQLGVPIHFIGLGEYTETISFFQRNIWISLTLFGALLLGALYFLVLSLRSKQKANYGLFSLMAFFAFSQLFAEISRGLFNYTYPVHDLRLIFIVLLSAGFGLCLLTYTLNKFTEKHHQLWLLLTVIAMAFAIILMPGFDGKTAVAILIPSLFSTLLIANKYRQQRSRERLGYLLVFIIFTLTIMLTFNIFHDMLFYYIITGMMTCLFVKQANELISEQAKRKIEEEQVSKLQFKLAQNQQEKTPKKLKVTSAGKTELLPTDTITYCKAAGDYVEIHLNNQQQSLYSGSLKSIESLLPSTFMKVHRSYIVNLDYILSIRTAKASGTASTASNGFLVLKDGEEVPVSRRILPMVRGVIDNI